MSKGIFVFVFGVAAGAAVAYLATKNKYESLIQEEIDSVKQAFRQERRKSEPAKKKEPDKTEDRKKAREEYSEKASKYVRYSGANRKEVRKRMEKNMADKPYVISPEEFDTLPDYTKITLTYYADGVLADDMDEIVEDVAETVGLSSLEHFGEYEDDSVYVRNDALKADYEILRDERTYENVTGYTVYGGRVEDE